MERWLLAKIPWARRYDKCRGIRWWCVLYNKYYAICGPEKDRSTYRSQPAKKISVAMRGAQYQSAFGTTHITAH